MVPVAVLRMQHLSPAKQGASLPAVSYCRLGSRSLSVPTIGTLSASHTPPTKITGATSAGGKLATSVRKNRRKNSTAVLAVLGPQSPSPNSATRENFIDGAAMLSGSAATPAEGVTLARSCSLTASLGTSCTCDKS